MRRRFTPIPFFTDNDVPDGVGASLRASGHSVVLLRNFMLTDSPDPIVAAACRENGLVLVTHNVRHFRSLSQKYESRHGEPDRQTRVLLECSQVSSPRRIKEAMDLIEAEWQRLGPEKRGLQVCVHDRWIRTHR